MDVPEGQPIVPRVGSIVGALYNIGANYSEQLVSVEGGQNFSRIAEELRGAASILEMKPEDIPEHVLACAGQRAVGACIGRCPRVANPNQ